VVKFIDAACARDGEKSAAVTAVDANTSAAHFVYVHSVESGLLNPRERRNNKEQRRAATIHLLMHCSGHSFQFALCGFVRLCAFFR
jgi:hypothetical protein